MGTVAVTSALPGDALARLAKVHRVCLHPGGSPLGGLELAEFAANADALITLLADNVDALVFALCPRLKIVANVAVGYNNIDAQAARAAGVWVTNTPDVLTEATADLTWALILAVTRRLVEADRVLRSGGFSGWKPDFMLGAGLQGKTLGIVGMGRIGRAVARRAAAFGLAVCYHDRSAVPVEQAPGAEFVAELERLLPRAELLSLHCPLTPETRHLLDPRRLHLLPKGAFVINTSRGGVVNEAALVEALEDGHLGGAGLDVYEREPAVHPGLLARRDVVLLPHVGSATWAARSAMAELAIENVLAVLSGGVPPAPVVTPPARG